MCVWLDFFYWLLSKLQLETTEIILILVVVVVVVVIIKQ